MASIDQSNRNITRTQAQPAQADYPAGSLRFDWTMTALSALFLTGLWIDGWAHFHNQVDDTFFTPWHLMFYGAFGILALFLGVNQINNVNRGHRFSKALPKGYLQSLIGVAVFALSGAGDMVWHTLFGIEGGTEALMSPSHIGLAVGMILVFSGPVTSVWSRGQQRGWRALGPMLVSIAMIVTLALFFTSYANPTVTPHILLGGRIRDMIQDFGVTSILFTTAIFSGITIPLLRRWPLPFGTYTLIFGLSTALLTVLNDFFLLIPGAILAGILVDILVQRFRPSQGAAWRLLVVTFLAPVLYYAQYFITISMVERIPWSIHVWSGSIFIAGVVGMSMALLTIISANTPTAE